jgi:hypothetical protein
MQLASLANRTFLSLWSYPGVHRAQFANGTGDGKELCDLLVVFENHILIFSDKSVAFQHGKPPALAWRRWYKSAIRKSADQIFGAERWLVQHPDRVYLDAACSQPFPVAIPRQADMRVHRIAVARGSGAAVEKFFGGDRGSLMLSSTVTRHQGHLESDMPFTIGQVDPERGFVHVLDDVTLEILLSTLDTVQDLIDYLERKERFMTSGRAVFAAGEEELLGYYLRDVGPDGKNDFVFEGEYSAVAIDQGFWDALDTHPQRQAQLLENKVSYLWDELVERFANHVLNDTQHASTNLDSPMDTEPLLRLLAREARTRRRMLSRSLIEVADALAIEEEQKVRIHEPSSTSDPHYVFMVTNRPDYLTHEDYRLARTQALFEYMQCTKLVYPDAKDIVGIAIDHPRHGGVSEDLAYLDARSWTLDDQKQAEQVQRITGFLSNVRRTEWLEKTYPDVESSPAPGTRRASPRTMKGRFRNKPCPCGSGIKHKKCCGR